MDQCISGLGVCYLAFDVFWGDRKVLNKFKCGLGYGMRGFGGVLGCFNGPHIFSFFPEFLKKPNGSQKWILFPPPPSSFFNLSLN